MHGSVASAAVTGRLLCKLHAQIVVALCFVQMRPCHRLSLSVFGFFERCCCIVGEHGRQVFVFSVGFLPQLLTCRSFLTSLNPVW